MKKALLVSFFPLFITAGIHKVVLTFDYEVNFTRRLSHFNVVSWAQLPDEPIYKAKINFSGTTDELIRDLGELSGVIDIEVNLSSTLMGMEAAARIDQRPIMILDDTVIDQRPIMILDEDELGENARLYMQKFLYDIRAQDCWAYTQGDGVVVAVLDTGIDPDHSFFEGSLSPYGYDFVDDDWDPSEERSGLDSNNNGLLDEGWGHGTHVAGIVKMVAPEVTILPIRVVDSDGHAEIFNIIQGIYFAIIAGADVINLSMSISEPSLVLDEWIDIARLNDVIVVTSAGNENTAILDYPADKISVLTVGSIDENFIKSSFSNFSKHVDVCTPGEHIISCLPGGGFVSRSGTSMSTPIVAGALALIRELVPYSKTSYFHNRLKNNAYSIDFLNPQYENNLGKGLLDVWNAITIENQPYPQ